MSYCFQVILLSSLLKTFTLASQVTKNEFISNFEVDEIVTPYHLGFEINLQDKRVYLENSLSLNSLSDYLYGFLELNDNSSSDSFIIPYKEKLTVNIEFFNLTESSSKKGTLKAIANIKWNNSINFNISDELITSHKFKKLESNSLLANYVEELSKNFSKKIINYLNNNKGKIGAKYFKVRTIGCSKVKNNKQDAKKEAVLFALARASHLTFGTEIINESQIIDYGDVTDEIKSVSDAIIIDYRIEESNLAYTSDEFCCLFVNALIRKKEY